MFNAQERGKRIFSLSVNLSCPYVQTSEIMLVITFLLEAK